MLLAILISTIFSSIAVFSYISDFIFGRIYFNAVLIFSFCVTAYIYLKLVSNGFKLTPGNLHTKNLFVFFIFIATFIYFLAPSFPTFYPLSLKWDGANHLSLANYLKNHLNHRDMIVDRYNLSWGGNLSTYPWGMHATLATISRLFKLNTFLFIYPFVSLIIATIVSSLVAYLLRLKTSLYSIILSCLFLIFSKFTFFYMVQYNHWSQILGILLFLSLIYFLEFQSQTNRIPLLPILLLTGVTLSYTLYAPILYLGFFVYSFLKKNYSLKYIISIIIISLIISFTYLFPAWISNLRILFKTGPVLWEGFFKVDSLLVLISYLYSIPICVFLIFNKKFYYYIFPILVFVFLAFALSGRVDQYWSSKICYLNMILFVPAFCAIFDEVISNLERIFKGKQLPFLLFLVMYTMFIINYPKYSITKLRPVFSQDEYRMRIWTEKNIGEAEVYYVTKGYKICWYEAIAERPKIKTPANFREIASLQTYSYVPEKQILQFLDQARQGDLILMDEKEVKILPTCFKVRHHQGDIVLFEFTDRGQ